MVNRGISGPAEDYAKVVINLTPEYKYKILFYFIKNKNLVGAIPSCRSRVVLRAMLLGER